MTINIDGTELFYVVKGSGRPLLMLHGNGEDHSVLEPLAGRLASHFTVYSLDSRNHGRSARTGDYSYRAMAGDLKGFVGKLGLHGMAVVGFSDGAIIAMMAQMGSGELFSKMVLMGPNLSPDDFTPQARRQIEQAHAAAPDPLLELMLTEPDIRPQELAGITVPVMVIAAQDDIFVPKTFSRIADALADSRLMIVPGHDHGSYILGNDMMYAPVLEFLTCGY